MVVGDEVVVGVPVPVVVGEADPVVVGVALVEVVGFGVAVAVGLLVGRGVGVGLGVDVSVGVAEGLASGVGEIKIILIAPSSGTGERDLRRDIRMVAPRRITSINPIIIVIAIRVFLRSSIAPSVPLVNN